MLSSVTHDDINSKKKKKVLISHQLLGIELSVLYASSDHNEEGTYIVPISQIIGWGTCPRSQICS